MQAAQSVHAVQPGSCSLRPQDSVQLNLSTPRRLLPMGTVSLELLAFAVDWRFPEVKIENQISSMLVVISDDFSLLSQRHVLLEKVPTVVVHNNLLAANVA